MNEYSFIRVRPGMRAGGGGQAWREAVAVRGVRRAEELLLWCRGSEVYSKTIEIITENNRNDNGKQCGLKFRAGSGIQCPNIIVDL